MKMRGRVLAIAGSDSGGGAGIQADIKTITALGGYAASAITALTAQDTKGVHGIHDVPAAFVRRQIEAVLKDIGADAIKIGMVHRADIIDAIADAIESLAKDTPLVVDPVMVAKGGAKLLDPTASHALKARLIVHATVLTPNIPEAEALTGLTAIDAASLTQAAAMLLTLGPRAVLLKGGHLPGDVVRDVLVTNDGAEVFESPRIASAATHGTGCTLASAIATGLAQGLSLRDAVLRARAFVVEAMRAAPGLGNGHGPLNHAITAGEFPAKDAKGGAQPKLSAVAR
jgi:hydroxymethylpyrimidine/phosphomethylpyrimidine kinase